MKTKKQLSALLLTAAILLTGSGCSQAVEPTEQQPVYDTAVHGEVTLQEMIDSYQGVDPDALKSDIGLLEKYCTENKDDKNASETVVGIYEDICDVYEHQHQQLVIAELLSYLDVSNEELSEQAARDSAN